VISYLRSKYRVRELIPTTLEDGFAGFNLMVMLWGLGIDSIRPKLEPKQSLKERLFSPALDMLPARTKI
jgi:hypothetical protein